MLDFLRARSNRWTLIVGLILCLFPWNERVSSIGIIALTLHTILSNEWSTRLRQFHWTSTGTWAVLFFLWHGVAFIWTNNTEAAWQSTQVKLSLFLLPVLFGLESHWTPQRRLQITIAFCVSLVLAFGYLLISAQITAAHLPLSARWQRMYFSEPLMHPGYLSNYFAAGIWMLSMEKQCWTTPKRKLLSTLTLLALLACILILIAKIVILFLLALGGYYIMKGLFNLISKPWLFWAVALPGMALFLFGVSQLPPVAKRLNETALQLAVVKPADINIANSTMSRKVAYGIEAQLLQEAGLWGFGTGMSNIKVLEKLEAGAYTQLVSAGMHVHNQYFNTGIALGWIGLALLLIFLLNSTYKLYQTGPKEMLFFSVLMLLNLGIDDMFEIQAGIVFFVFGIFLFTSKPLNERN